MLVGDSHDQSHHQSYSSPQLPLCIPCTHYLTCHWQGRYHIALMLAPLLTSAVLVSVGAL